MTTLPSLLCDGCGQAASPEHVARRLQRLELATRYRPIHIGTLLLGAASPPAERDYLYAGGFGGEGGALLEALGMAVSGRPAEEVVTEFQKGGFFLTYVLECPVETDAQGGGTVAARISARIPAVAARIRRSLKPKRVVFFSQELETVLVQLSEKVLGCTVVLDGAKPFSLGGKDSRDSQSRLREALLAGGASAR